MEKIKQKLKLDRHHLMERFGVLMLVIMAMLVSSIGLTFAKYRKDNSETLTSQAVYTSEFTTSKTELKGSVVNVFSNKNHTKSFVLLKFDSADSMSIDAKNYEVYLTGSNMSTSKTELKSKPTGCIYVFGHTGYMGIYLVDNRSFTSQIIKMTIRNYSELQKAESEEQVVYDDESYNKYDQFDVYFNPGASGTTNVDCLNTKTVTPSAIYSDIVAAPMETEYKAALNDDLKNMKLQINKILDYRTSRFVNDGIAIPDIPKELKGDNVSDPDENGYYHLTTKTIVPGGYNVEWQTGSIKEGYLDKICNGMSYTEFFASKEKERSESEDDTASWTSTEWYRTDGSRIVMGETRLDAETAMQNDIEGYKQALSDYYSLKKKYMTTDMYNLLLLEANTKSVDTYYTVNDSDSSIFIY